VLREANSDFFRDLNQHSIATLPPSIGSDNFGLHLFTKDAMKRTTRLSIEFQQREVTITVAGSTLHVQGSEPGTRNTPTVCPTCGSPWITIVAQVNGEVSANTDRICRALQQSGLHLQVTPAGQLRICQSSFEELKENL
jgi:hypothetical protein